MEYKNPNTYCSTKPVQAQRQISKLEQIQDLAYSYGIFGNTLSAFECFANRQRPQKAEETNVFSAYNNFNCGNTKTLDQLRAQIITQLTILQFSYMMYTMQYKNYDFDEDMNAHKMIELLELWRSWVPEKDQKYYNAAITIVNGGKPPSFTDELKSKKNEKARVNPRMLANSVGLMHNSYQVGLKAVEKYKKEGITPKMKINSTKVGSKKINESGKEEKKRREEIKKIDDQYDKIGGLLQGMIDANGNQKKADKIYLIYIKEMENFIRSYENFVIKNQLYWYKDNYYKNEAKLQDFKRNYKTLIRIYDESNFRQLRDWVYPSSFR